LKVQLLGGDIAALSVGNAANAPAYDAYLQGKRLYDRGGGDSPYRAALAKFDQAIAADPGYAAAYAARARVLVILGDQFVGPDKLRATYAQAVAAAQKAVSLAPALADAQATLAETLASANLDFAGARKAFAQAMVSGAGQADILTTYGLFTCNSGDFQAGLAAARRATVLDPLNPRVFKYLGYGLLGARHYPEAIAAMRRALQLSPGTQGAHYTAAEALMLQGQLAAARDEFAIEPVRWLRLTGQAIVLERLGDGAGARSAFADLMGGTGDVTFYQQAQVHAQWGETDPAVAALQAAVKAGDSGLAQLYVDPLLDPLRRDARYKSLVVHLGLAA
ncbi:MAG: TPR end-of-group domain-containing protein, partial [Caulobacteraceae bacterium]